MLNSRAFPVLCAFALATVQTGYAEEILVQNQSAYREAVKRLKPGDELVLADGKWRDFQIEFEAVGTKEAPIVLRAETPGEVIISGRSNLKIAGEHLIVSGLTFRDGYSPTDEVVSFRLSEARLASNVRFTQNTIAHFNKPDRKDQDAWVVLYGRDNHVDYNALLGKTNKGVTLIVRLTEEASQNNNHLIENNYFGPRDPLGGNGGETIRIGTSFTSRTNSGTVIRSNYFEHCDGEVEIISIKSEGNLITENVFFESRGSVVFRHGGSNEVSRNVFLGNGVSDTGGIRVINDNQTVKDNYLEGLRGEKFLGALVVMNGVPNSPDNRYHQVDTARITNNSFVDIAHIGLGVGTDEERSAVPINSEVAGNLFTSSTDKPVGIFDDMGGIEFAENMSSRSNFTEISAAVDSDLQLARNEHGLLIPNKPVGAPTDLTPILRDNTGPAYFEKPTRKGLKPKVIRVGQSEVALRQAVRSARPGDVLQLSDGEVKLEQPIGIDKPLVIRGSDRVRPSVLISSEDGMFNVLADGGLILQQVIIEQTSSTEAVLRGRGERYKGAYSLKLENVKLQASHGLSSVAPLIAADPETFATSIEFSDTHVREWPGTLINLDGNGLEGWYLSDLVSIEGSSFQNVRGPLIVFGREGRDESTFGPRFSFTDSLLVDVSRSGKVLDLNGIDGVQIAGNRFERSGGLSLKRRVLGYPFEIIGNDSDGMSSVDVRGVDGAPVNYDLDQGAM